LMKSFAVADIYTGIYRHGARSRGGLAASRGGQIRTCYVRFMNFSIHVDDELGNALDQLARVEHRSRNALIREALREFVASRQRQRWPESVKRLAGADPGLPPFEDHRGDLGAVADDPLR
jgi:predicted transcriptional regulator